MTEMPPFPIPPSRAAKTVATITWLILSAAVGLALGPAYGLFLAWAGIAFGAFLLNPLAAMAGLLVLNVAAADWGQALVLFPDKPYNINQAGLSNLVMVGLAMLYVLRRRPRRAALTWPFLAFLAAGLISIAFSQSPSAGLRDWSRFVPLLGVYVVTADLLRDSPRRARLWIGVAVISSAWPAVVAVYQFLTGAGYHNVPDLNRLLGTLRHPIAYGTFLGMVVILSLFLLRESKNGRVRAALAFWGLLSLTLLFFTYARGPALALTASLITLALFARRETWVLRGGAITLAVAFLLVAVLVGYTEDLHDARLYRSLTPVPTEAVGSIPAPTPVQRPTPTGGGAFRTIEGHVRLQDSAGGEGVPGVAIRWSSPTVGEGSVTLTDAEGYYRIDVPPAVTDAEAAIWAQLPGYMFEPQKYLLALDELGSVTTLNFTAQVEGAAPVPTPAPTPAIVEGVNSLSWRLNLWRFGIDLAVHHPVIGIGLGSFPLNSPRLVGWEVTPHNDFVRVFAEMGTVGLLAYLWLWLALGRSLVGLWRHAPNRSQALLGAILISIAACYLVNSLSADLLNYPTLGWLFWSLAALPEAFRAGGET